MAVKSHSHRLSREQPGYYEAAGGRLYTVLHTAERAQARVLLIGPFASERHYSYLPWVQWARFLAVRGFDVLRFDYRGVGESEGAFEELSFEHWQEDVLALSHHLTSMSPELPLMLHGLEIGALLAAAVFQKGLGDALLMWSAPATANAALRTTLLRWVVADQLFKYGNDRRPASAYIRELEEGSAVEVEGYAWSSKQWRDSFTLELSPALTNAVDSRGNDRRPIRTVKLTNDAIPLVKGSNVVANELKDFTSLFTENSKWLMESIPACVGDRS